MTEDTMRWHDFWRYLSSPRERELWDRYEDRRYGPPDVPSVEDEIARAKIVPITWTSADNDAWPPTDGKKWFVQYNSLRKGRTEYLGDDLPLDAQTQKIRLEGHLWDFHHRTCGVIDTEISVSIAVTTAVEKYGRDYHVTLLTGDEDAPFHQSMLSVNGEDGILTWFNHPDSIIYRIAFYNGAGTPHHPRIPTILRLDYASFDLNRIFIPAGLGRELFKDHNDLSGSVDTGTIFYETESSGSLAKKVVSCFRGMETRNLNDPRNGLRFIRHLASSICTW